jgi:DNA-binding NtrC family response regulator
LSTVLIVDDDAAFRKALAKSLERKGYQTATAEHGGQALQYPKLLECDAVVADMKMPVMDGITLLHELHELDPDLPVIVLTGHGDIESAIDAIKKGAFHYFTKPCEIAELDVYLQKAIENRRVVRENKNLRNAMKMAERDHGIAGNSPAIKQLLQLIDRVKDSDAPALIAGESGTGKELVARALHFQSKRKDMPFIALNCATLKPELLENELFGHVAGAFTGATAKKDGLLSIANNGTLFIDEIADMDLNVQASLLRVIETGEFRPLGSTKEQKTNVRIVAAANRDLTAEVQHKKFREDLFYRLSVIVIQTPPLRGHLEDIPLLVSLFLQRSATGKQVAFSKEAIDVLQQHSWKGNVRELYNICERALLMRSTDQISAPEITLLLSMNPTIQSNITRSNLSSMNDSKALDDVERNHIEQVLHETIHNISKTAEVLGIDRRTLQRKMDRYGLDR